MKKVMFILKCGEICSDVGSVFSALKIKTDIYTKYPITTKFQMLNMSKSKWVSRGSGNSTAETVTTAMDPTKRTTPAIKTAKRFLWIIAKIIAMM